MKTSKLSLSFLFLCFISCLHAQTAALLEGIVLDPSGAAISDAQVDAVEVNTMAEHFAQTDPHGRYTFVDLPPGPYRLQASAPGFQTQIKTNVTLSAGDAALGEFHLEVQPAAEHADVVAQLPMLSASAAQWGGGTERESLAQLPLNGRDLFELAGSQQASTVTNLNRVGFVGGFGAALSFNGGRPNQNGFRIDGIQVNDATGLPPISAAGRLLGIESIQELSVITSPFSAEYGRAAAAVISAISRSGGNDWHGSAFEYFRNDALDARNFFDVPAYEKPPFHRNQFGGMLSGPAIKNKLFFFVNPESIRQTQALTNTANTPNANARNGLIPQANGTTLQVPVSLVAQPYLALFPLPNGPDNGDGTGQYTTEIPTSASENFLSMRVDALFSPRWRAAARGSFDHAVSDTQDTYQFYRFHNETHYAYASVDTHFLESPSLIQDFRVGVSRNWNSAVPNVDPRVPSSLSFLPGQAFGVLQITGLADFGNNRAVISDLLLATTDAQFHYGISYTHGSQSLEAGAGYTATQTNPALDVNTRGLYVFGSLASFLSGQALAANLTIPGSLSARTFTQQLGYGFVQYENRLSRSLTLSVGVRYEPYSAPSERNGGLATMAFNAANTIRGIGGPLYANPSRLNFAPRLGLAWNPGGSANTVIRAGFGIFYDTLGPTIYVGNRGMSPSQYQSVTTFAPPFPGLAAVVGNLKTPPTLDMVDYNVQQPYTIQYQLKVEHQLGQNTAMDAEFAGNRGVHLAGHVGDINPPKPVALAGGQIGYIPGSPDINPAFGQIGMLRTQFNLFYNALALGLRHRWSNGLSVESHYTFGKTIDETSDVLFQDFLNSDKVPNPFNYRANRGLADYNITHAFAVNATYALPWHDATGWSRVRGNWEVSILTQAQSGRPFSPDVGFDRAGLGGLDDLGQRPNLVLTPGAALIQGSPSQYFNPLAFSLPAAGTYGNLGRNVLIGPGLFTMDAAIQKRLIQEHKQMLVLRLEGFNITNRPNFQNPSSLALFTSSGSRIGSAGQITTTTTTSRQLQLVLRYEF